MKTTTHTTLLILILSMLGTEACLPGPPGMDLYALQTHQVTPLTQTRIPIGFGAISGVWIADTGYNSYAQNLGTRFQITLDGTGRGHVDNTRLPAEWAFTFLFPTRCVNQTIRENVELDPGNKGFALLLCQRIDGIHPFLMNPATVDAQAMPSSFASTGEGVDITYGMPELDFYDEYGRITASTFITDVSIDQQGLLWLGGSMPSLPYSCTYTVAVNNVLADGSLDYIGVTTLDVINGQALPPLPEPPPNPDPTPGGCGDDSSGVQLSCENY